MQTKAKYLVLVLASFVLAGCATCHSGSRKVVQQWEYSAVDFSNRDIGTVNTALNNLANVVWALVSAVPVKCPNGEEETRYIFKRPKH